MYKRKSEKHYKAKYIVKLFAQSILIREFCGKALPKARALSCSWMHNLTIACKLVKVVLS